MRAMTLITHGWHRWERARRLLDGAEGVWLGPTGIIHLDGDAWPEMLPQTTRIHAWSGRDVWRLVPDHARDRVLVTRLSDDPPLMSVDSAAGSDGPTTRSRSVRVQASVVAGWRRLVILEGSSVTFLRRDENQGQAQDA